ncbi:MAG: ABC transporter permease subunit [Firmicutes bacterium]|nr:ABC transporter permease subunit [Bacillota bacterium]
MRTGILKSPWVGFKNFEFLFNSSDTYIITRNTICYNLVFIFLGLIISVGLAILLNEIKNKILSKTYQTILIMPYFLSFVVVSYLVYAFLNTENGFINKQIISALGMDAKVWYVDPKPWPIILTIVNFWKNMGYSSIVYLAAIAGIDAQLYEAAQIDGATRWQQIKYVTLPSLKTIMTIMTILNIGKIFNADFGLFYQVTMNSGALYPTTYVINTYVYNMMIAAGTASTGMAAAAALYQSLVGFILIIVTNWWVKKYDPDSALF